MNTTTAPTEIRSESWSYVETIVAASEIEAKALLTAKAYRDVPFATVIATLERITPTGRFTVRITRRRVSYIRDIANGNRAHRVDFDGRTLCGEEIETAGTMGHWESLSGDDGLCTDCAWGITR